MRSKLATLLAALCLVLAGARGAGAGDAAFAIEPEPAWVVSEPLPAAEPVPRTEIRDGIYFLLEDTQVDVARAERYARSARLITDAAGVESGSELSIGFDPTYQRLAIHTACIRRGDLRLERLDAAKVKVVQRETDLERHLYDGRLSALLFLDDVRAGDVIELAYTIRGRNPILGDRFVGHFESGYSVPVAEVRFRLLWPEGRALSLRNHGPPTPDPLVRDLSGGGREYLWRLSRVPAFVGDGEAPAWFDAYPWVQLSEFASWADVSRWALALYGGGGALPAALRARVDAIRDGYERDEDRVVAATRFVQDEIRYLGMEVGVGTHRPATPGVVFTRRFGDCKDKTNLLCAMLSALGVEAHPALINTSARRSLDLWQPSPYAFDHVVVCASLAGKTLWLDPTISHQRGALDQLFFPPYGRSLVVREGTGALTEIPAAVAGAPRISVRETFGFDGLDYRTLDLAAESRYEGSEAVRMRDLFAGDSRASLERRYLDFYAHAFPTVATAAALRFEDDEAANVVTTREAYRAVDPWTISADGTDAELWLTAHAVRDGLFVPRTVRRIAPLAVAFPRSVKHTIVVRFPTGWRLAPAGRKSVEDEAFSVTLTSRYQEQKLTLDFEYEARADAVAPTRVAEYVRHVEAARKLLDYGLRRDPRARQPTSDLSEAISRSLPASPDGISRGSRDSTVPFVPLIACAVMVGGVIGLTYLVGRVIPDGLARSRARSQLRREIQRVEGEIHYLDKPHLHARLGRLRLELGEPAAAATAFSAALERADEVEHRYGLAEAELALGRHAEALAHLEKVVAREPDHAFGDARRLLARTLVALGRFTEARPILEALLRERPSIEARLLLALVLERQGEWSMARAQADHVRIEWLSLSPDRRREAAPLRREAARLLRRIA